MSHPFIKSEDIRRFLSIVQMGMRDALRVSGLTREAEDYAHELRLHVSEYGQQPGHQKLGVQLYAAITVALELMDYHKKVREERAQEVDSLIDSLSEFNPNQEEEDDGSVR